MSGAIAILIVISCVVTCGLTAPEQPLKLNQSNEEIGDDASGIKKQEDSDWDDFKTKEPTRSMSMLMASSASQPKTHQKTQKADAEPANGDGSESGWGRFVAEEPVKSMSSLYDSFMGYAKEEAIFVKYDKSKVY